MRCDNCRTKLALAAMLLLLAIGCSKTAKTTRKAENNDKQSASKSQPPTGVAPPGPPAQPISSGAFPRPDGVKVVATNAGTRSIMLRGPNRLDEFRRFYETQLAERGWKKNEAASQATAGVGLLVFDKGSLSIRITFDPSRDGNTLSIVAQGTGIIVPDDKPPDGTP